MQLSGYFDMIPDSSKYKTRFVKESHAGELINLYHLARTALAGNGVVTSYDRMVWASGYFAKEHSDVSSTGAYKDLCGLLGK